MAPPKTVSEEEQKRRKNERSRQRYLEKKEEIAKYHAERYRERSANPEFRLAMAEKARLWREKNPDASKIQNKKRRDANPEEARRQCREWFAKNPDKRAAYEQNRRARKKYNGGKLSPGLKARLFDLQKGCCACCFKKLSIGRLHMDHVVPLAKGGAHEDQNIQLLCQPCNQSKYAKHPIDFMQEKGFLL